MRCGPDVESEGRRLFYALWPSDSVAEALALCIARLASRVPGRWVRRENLHLTLWFVGMVAGNQLQRFTHLAELPVGRFTLELTRLRYQRRRRLLWIEPTGIPAALRELETGLRAALADGTESGDRQPLAPHVTLGRNVVPDTSFQTVIEPLVWPIDSLSLVESVLSPGGAQYRVLRRWRLRSMPAEGSMK